MASTTFVRNRKSVPKKKAAKTQTPPKFAPESRSIVVASKYVAIMEAFVSTEEVRYYLTGIYIERHPVCGVIMVATDGHRMAVIHDKDALFKGKGGWICPVPSEVFKACKKKMRKGEGDLGAQQVHFVGATVGVTNLLYAAKGPLDLKDGVPDGVMTISRAGPIDGTYPQWRRVLPKKRPATATHEVLAFSPGYMADFATVIKAAGLRENAPAVMFPSPLGEASIVRFEALPEFFGLLMGCHASPDMTAIPAWVAAERATFAKKTKAAEIEAREKTRRGKPK